MPRVLVIAVVAAMACRGDKPATDPAPPQDRVTATRDAIAIAVAIDASVDASATVDGGSDLGAPPVGMDPDAAKACSGGDAVACVRAARSYAPQGAYRSTSSKLTRAEADAHEAGTTRYARRGCELGAGEGCALVAQFGHGSSDPALARACELGYLASCGSIGDATFYSTKRGSAERRDAAALVERACTENVVDWRALTNEPGAFCHELGVWYRDGELAKDPTRARHFIELACSQGYRIDCPCTQDADCGRGNFCAERACQQASTE